MTLITDPRAAAFRPAGACTTTADAAPMLDAAPTLDDVIAEVAARRDEFDRLGHVPRDMIGTMKRAGIFRASTPRCFGGDALPPATFMRTRERIAAVDGSAAWVAAFGSANVYLASLPLETQEEIYATGPDQVFAGGLYPLQMAEAAPGGWRATGRWRFASGCKGADWLGVGIGVPATQKDGTPGVQALTAVCPATEVEIVENWSVLGMQGTGSHDLRLDGKLFGAAWTCRRGGDSVIDEPLYRYPAVAYQAQVHAAVNIGLARAALDILAGMSGIARATTTGPRLADRAYYRIELRHAAHASAEVVQTAFRVAGMAAVQKTHRLQHILRDAMVVAQHAALNEGTFEGAGAVLAGLPPGMAYP